jgi:hypothetical protein
MVGSANNYLAGTLGIGTISGLDATQAIRIGKALTGSTSAYGIVNLTSSASDVTTGHTGFYGAAGTGAGAYTLTNLYSFTASQGTIGAGSTVTNQFGFNVNSNFINGTNNYGFYGNIASGTGRYNFYAAGTADNYFAGRLGIGSLGLTDALVPCAINPTGATTVYGFRQFGTIQSDVTAAFVGYQSIPSTQATAFTLTNLRHFVAQQGTLGASSAITNQFGFEASLTLTGATNNYGFYSNIASGTGRWNFYAAGTADNYFAGNVGIGVAPTVKLDVSGEIRATNNITAYYTSDIKFKENIQPIKCASEIVRLIGADYFDWTDDYIAEHGGEDGYFIQKADFGVVAQKVQKVFPKAVRIKPDGTLAVDYEKLGVLAFPAIAEILERLDRIELRQG